MKNAPTWLSAATADRAMAWLVIGGVLLVIILLVRSVGHLSKHASRAAMPAPSPKKSGGGGKLLLLAAAGVGGWVLFERHQSAAAPAKAVPAPAPHPVPRPTVTQTVAPHVTHVTLPAHFPLTGTQILIGVVVVAVVGYLITRVVVRNAL